MSARIMEEPIYHESIMLFSLFTFRPGRGALQARVLWEHGGRSESQWDYLHPGRVPMASHRFYCKCDQGVLWYLPCCWVCIYSHPNLPIRTDWIHAFFYLHSRYIYTWVLSFLLRSLYFHMARDTCVWVVMIYPLHYLPMTLSENFLRRPARLPDAELQAVLKFYNPALHQAAFCLPEFARRKLEESRVRGGFAPRDISFLSWLKIE